MASWIDYFKYNPIKPLLESGNESVIYYTNGDLLNLPVKSIDTLWTLKIPQKILKKQQPDGSWIYPSKINWLTTDYNQLETYRQLGFLIQMFGFNNRHPAIEKTAEYFFSKQSKAGDFRGIYAAQYSPNYTAAIAELLILAGYKDDPRIHRVFKWLLAVRQNDGGWALPLRTRGRNLDAINEHTTIEPDKSKLFSHLITGIVLRPFAAHPKYAQTQGAKKAGELLTSRFFQNDVYTDLKSASAWETFSYPFWNTDLISSLHVLTKLGFTKDNQQIQNAMSWLLEKQTPDGTLNIHKNHDRYHDQSLWLTLAFCRIIKILY